MSILDRADQWESLDSKAMRILLETFPSQIAEAAAIARRFSLRSPKQVSNIVVCGLGGSAIGADVIRSAMTGRLTAPMVVHRDYDLPGFVDARTLVVACSYSGNTEETLSAYRAALRIGAALACITSGGELAALTERDGVPMIRIPPGLPPRAAIGYSTTSLLRVLHSADLLPDPAAELEETVHLTTSLIQRYSSAVPEESNLAKRVARSLHGRVVAVYASGKLLGAAALRWRGQMEENAKNLAFHHLLPEMNHNELVGWNLPADTLREIAVALLRDKEDHPKVQRRFDLTREALEGVAGGVQELWSEGTSPLARIFSLICLGDFVSLYLAYLNGVDPTPVHAIERLKKRLDE